METLQAIKSRRSIRKFKSDMIPKDILDKIIEAGTYAPTGRGAQSPIIILSFYITCYKVLISAFHTIFRFRRKKFVKN